MFRESGLLWVACAFSVASGCGLDERALNLGSDSTNNGARGGSDLGNAGEGGEITCVTQACSTGGDDPGGGSSAAGEPSGGNSASGGAGGDDAINGGGAGGAPPSGLIGTCPDRNGNSVADCDETLAVNGAYDHDVASWQQEAGVALLWQGLDSEGIAESGSASVTYQGYQDSEGIGLAGSVQCIALSGALQVAIWADILIKGGQGSGQGLINLLFYSSADCSGALLPTGAYATPAVSAPGEWVTVSGSAQVPVGAGSIKLRLGVGKPFRNPSLEVLFDNLLIEKH